MSTSEIVVRQINATDYASLAFLVNNAEYIHRHLDWRTPLDWIGEEPFLGIEKTTQAAGFIGMPAGFIDDWVDTPVRFLNWSIPQMEECWGQLFQTILATIPPETKYTFAGLGLQPWFAALLEKSGFTHRQNIVVLQWIGSIAEQRSIPPEIILRPMGITDLEKVLLVDNAAFDPLWQHNIGELKMAFQQAAHATVLDMNGEIVGYQISTGTPFHAHLARLAVDPGLQRMSLGYALVRDLLQYFMGQKIFNITVNTQSDNASSLALYQKIGFQRTGDDFPVYTYSIY